MKMLYVRQILPPPLGIFVQQSRTWVALDVGQFPLFFRLFHPLGNYGLEEFLLILVEFLRIEPNVALRLLLGRYIGQWHLISIAMLGENLAEGQPSL